MDCFALAQLLLRMGFALECDWYIQCLFTGEIWFPLLQQVSSVNEFWVRGWTWCLAPLLHAGILSFPNLCGSCVLSQSLCVHVCQSSSICKTFSWSHPSPLTPIIFLPPLPHRSLSFGNRGLLKISHLGLSAPKTFNVCTLSSCGSLC